jgi:hypothetical protein
MATLNMVQKRSSRSITHDRHLPALGSDKNRYQDCPCGQQEAGRRVRLTASQPTVGQLEPGRLKTL